MAWLFHHLADGPEPLLQLVFFASAVLSAEQLDNMPAEPLRPKIARAANG